MSGEPRYGKPCCEKKPVKLYVADRQYVIPVYDGDGNLCRYAKGRAQGKSNVSLRDAAKCAKACAKALAEADAANGCGLFTSSELVVVQCAEGEGWARASATRTSTISEADARAAAIAAATEEAKKKLVCTFYGEQTVTVSCPSGVGEATATASRSSTQSQAAADMLAYNAALEEATANLVCTWSSTRSATVFCQSGVGNSTQVATRTSNVSQQDADDLAYAAALAAAQAALVCTWTSTQAATAHCPEGQAGSATVITTRTSNVSQEDADALAYAAALATAQSLLICLPLWSFEDFEDSPNVILSESDFVSEDFEDSPTLLLVGSVSDDIHDLEDSPPLTINDYA